MPRGFIDFAGLKTPRMRALKNTKTPTGLPFAIRKIGHAVLMVSDIERSVKFYTQVLGFRMSDVYTDAMVPGKMVFMRFNHDHHGIGLVGRRPKDKNQNIELDHMAFEVGTLDEVLRAAAHLRKHKVQIDFEGRRRAGCQVAVEFRDPDGHRLEIFWGLDQVGSDGHVRLPGEWREAQSFADAIREAPRGQDTTLSDPKLLKQFARRKPAARKTRPAAGRKRK